MSEHITIVGMPVPTLVLVFGGVVLGGLLLAELAQRALWRRFPDENNPASCLVGVPLSIALMVGSLAAIVVILDAVLRWLYVVNLR